MKTLTRAGWFGIETITLLTAEERAALPLIAQTRRDPQCCGFGWTGWSTVTPREGYFGLPQSDRSVLVYFAPALVGVEREVTTGYGGSRPLNIRTGRGRPVGPYGESRAIGSTFAGGI